VCVCVFSSLSRVCRGNPDSRHGETHAGCATANQGRGGAIRILGLGLGLTSG